MKLIKLAALPLLSLSLFAADPWLGAWTMNMEKSKISGPGAKALVMRFEQVGDHVRCTEELVRQDGKKMTIERVAASYDGKAHPIEYPFNLKAVE